MILVHMAEAKSLVMILLFGASRFHPSRSRKTLQNQRDLVFELALYTIPEVMFST
ncbi:AGAP004894-PA [Anopheles gambiae str. PEST]|uniref:AGAP004894-PA n=3 Tax=gambiae species complex TaxID=44542 RepID=A0NE68_ANOGA|nr:AGAP004894-PA [Anopheles gambiae str. PEST]